jgi:hypothetical protein
MLQSSAFASPPIPLSNYPEKKNRRKEKQQIDRGEGAEADANHCSEGNGAGSRGRLISLPHSMVAMPQTVAA